MTRIARWPSLLLLLILLAWLPEYIPGFGVTSEEGLRFSIGTLLLDVVDPLVVVFAIGAALLLVATLVELAGMRHIASTGGQGNPAVLEHLVGRMLVPVAAGGLVATCAWLLPAVAGWSRRPAHDPEAAR